MVAWIAFTFIIALYLIITVLLPALLLPNYLIYKPHYKITSKKLVKEIRRLNKIKDDEKFVKAAFDFVTKRYQSADPLTFLFNLPRLFWHNPNKIIHQKGFAYCHVQNLILKTILLESKRFKEDQITTKLTLTVIIHQYLVLKTNKLNIELDPYGYTRSIPYGKHLNTRNFLFG
jgi:hypothetical protein